MYLPSWLVAAVFVFPSSLPSFITCCVFKHTFLLDCILAYSFSCGSICFPFISCGCNHSFCSKLTVCLLVSFPVVYSVLLGAEVPHVTFYFYSFIFLPVLFIFVTITVVQKGVLYNNCKKPSYQIDTDTSWFKKNTKENELFFHILFFHKWVFFM